MRVDVERDSIWPAPPDLPEPMIPARSNTDVCVVGAGIAGLSVAYQLARAGRRVVVLDDGPVGGGNTGRTTAHLSNVIDDRFTEVERVRGADAGRLAAESHGRAIDFIEEAVARENIACDFERLDGYLFAATPDDQKLLEREEEAARRAGLAVERVARAPLGAFDTGPCLRFANQAQFDPVRYLEGLAQAVLRAGGKIATNTHVVEIKGGSPARVSTRGGQALDAGAVVVATNSPVNDRVVIHTKQAPYLTYAVAFHVPPGAVHRALYWDTLDPYHYVRLARPGADGEEFLVVGGEDHKTGQAHDHEERFRRLTDWTRARFPEAGAVAYRWTGQVLETLDGLAFIGRNPGDEENVFIATGDSGMGMTHGTIAGLLLADLILGRDNPWTDLYDPARKPVHSLGTFLSENLNVTAQYGAWVTPGEVASVEQIPKGCGAVVRQGLHKLAVYRDEHDQLCYRSAVCPHLEGIVHWNAAERTWDCPLHGSRFARFGKVINGPANSDLEVKERSDHEASD